MRRKVRGMKRRAWRIVAVLLLALCLAACGGGPEMAPAPDGSEVLSGEEQLQEPEPQEQAGSDEAVQEQAGNEAVPGMEDGEAVTAPETEEESTPTPAENPGEAAPTEPAAAEDEAAPPEESAAHYVTFSISCATILDNLDRLDPSKADIVPADGVILAAQQAEFTPGESVFDLLQRETRANEIHMEFSSTAAFDSNYVEGIANLYEFDCGDLSGWTYKLNGERMGVGCSLTLPEDGDLVEWVYTCDLGNDI